MEAPRAVTGMPSEQHCQGCGVSVGIMPGGVPPQYFYCGGHGVCKNVLVSWTLITCALIPSILGTFCRVYPW